MHRFRVGENISINEKRETLQYIPLFVAIYLS